MWHQLMNRKLFASFSLLLLMQTMLSAQDRVYLVGEDKPEVGKITGTTKLEVKFETRKKESKTFTPPEIDYIKWDKEPTRFSAARNMEAKGDFSRALEAYQDAKRESSGGSEQLKEDLTFHRLRTEAKMVMAGEELAQGRTPEKISKELQVFLDDHKLFYAYYSGRLLLGRFYLHQQQSERALEVFAELQKTPWPEYQIWGYTAEGRQNLNQGEVEAALKLFEQAIKLPVNKSDEQLAQAEAMLGKAECLSKLIQSDQALSLVEELIDNLPETATKVQARVYLTQGRLYEAAKRNKEATVAFLHVDILFPTEAKEHAEALYHLSTLWAALGKPDRAAIATNKLEQQYPESEWVTKTSGTN